MKRKLKQFLSALIVVVMIVGSAPLSGFAGLDLPNLADLFTLKADAATESGKCGDNLTWSLDTDTGVLTISGTGDMYNWSSGSYAPWYSKRSSVKTVVIGDSVTSIGNRAFDNCTSLTSVTIPDSVTSIGYRTFYDCTSLTSITIPDSVTSMGANAFYGTGVYNNSSNWENNVLYIGNHLISAKTSITGDYTIKFGTKTIACEAFFCCTGLTSVTIPDSVTSIGVSAFEACESLTSVTIPDSVTSIGDWVFAQCTGLTSVTIGNSVTSIGEAAFWLCTSLTSVTIGNSVTSIGEGAFSDCTSLTSITIPDSVTSIGNGAFYLCTSLTSITVKEGNPNYSSDEYGVLFNKDKTLLIRYPIGNTRTSYTIPDSVTSIGSRAFEDCTGLTSVTIPDSVTSIGSSAFFCCTGLTSITIPDSVTSIGSRAFEACTRLTDVYYTGSEEEWQSISIGDYNECLTNATIHYNSVTDSNYTVSFDLNGGLGTLEKQTKNQGEPLTLTSAEPIRTGYIFKSWNTEASGEGMTYLPGSTYNDDKTVVLYAQWEPITYTVRFYDSDTLLDSKVLSYDETGTLSCSFTPEKKGYVFVGWSNIENGSALFEDGIEIKNLSAENGGSVSYYSVWEKIQDKELEDERTGIQVSAPGGTFDSDVTLKVEEVLSGSSFDIIGKVNGKSKTKVFTIEIYVDGQSVQPNGDVTVRIPVPDGFNAEKCKLYYLNTSSKNPEEIAFRVEDGYIVFTTNRFGDWAIIQTAEMPTVSVNDIGLNYKKSVALNPSVTVDDNASYTVTYTSSDTSVARVDENGKVYGAKKGSAEITVTVTDEYGNTVSDTCKVNVTYAWWQWIIVIVLFGWIWY